MTASTTRRTTANSAKSRIAAVGAIAVAGTLLLTGCGDQTDKSGSGDSTKDSSASASKYKLPAKIKDAGVIKVGSDIAYAPMEFDQDGTPTGVDIDLATALGKELGVDFKFENGTFDNLIPSLDSGRYDLIMSAMSDTKERQAKVDFVDYFSAGVSILVKKGNPEGIKSAADLCGKTIAFQRGTVSAGVAKSADAKCPAGKKIKTLTYDTDPEALLQVKQGRAVADLNDFPVAAYNAKTSGGGKDFEVTGDQVDEGPYGIAVTKENTELREAVSKALDAIIANGEYGKVLKKWNVEQGAVDKPVLNGGSE